MRSLQSPAAYLLGVVAWAMVDGVAPAQSLAARFQTIDEEAVQASHAARTAPDPSQLPALIALLADPPAEANAADRSRTREVRELAFAVLGWWSAQDAPIGERLLDAAGDQTWPMAVRLNCVALASLGAAESRARAETWLDSEGPSSRRLGFELLARTGPLSEGHLPAVVAGVRDGDLLVRQSAARCAAVCRTPSAALTEALEAWVAAAADFDEKSWPLWAMVHRGEFDLGLLFRERTDRWEDLYLGEFRQSVARFDAWFHAAPPGAARSVLQQLDGLGERDRRTAIKWCLDHGDEPGVVEGLLAAADRYPDSRYTARLLLIAERPADPELLSYWTELLHEEDHTAAEQACRALSTYGSAAATCSGRLAELAAHPFGPRRTEVDMLRASALLALGSIGPEAAEHLPLVESLVEQKSERVISQPVVRWALPRLRGQAPETRVAELQPEQAFLRITRDPHRRFLGDLDRAFQDWTRLARRADLPAARVPALLVGLGPEPTAPGWLALDSDDPLRAEPGPLAVPRLLDRVATPGPALFPVPPGRTSHLSIRGPSLPRFVGWEFGVHWDLTDWPMPLRRHGDAVALDVVLGLKDEAAPFASLLARLDRMAGGRSR